MSFRIIRLLLAALAGGLVTIIVAALALCLRPFGLRVANIGTHLWGRLGSAVCYRIMGIHVRIETVHRLFDPDHPVIFFGSHPRTFALMAYALAISRACPRRMLIPSIKSEHKWNPFGWGAYLMGAILLNRARGEEAVSVIHHALRRLKDHSFALSIYLDGSRGNAEKRENALQWVLQQPGVQIPYPVLYEVSQLLLLPRWKGAEALASALPDAQWVRVDVAANSTADSLFDLMGGEAPVISVRLVRVEAPPTEKMALLNELLGHWAETAEYMRAQRQRR